MAWYTTTYTPVSTTTYYTPYISVSDYRGWFNQTTASTTAHKCRVSPKRLINEKVRLLHAYIFKPTFQCRSCSAKKHSDIRLYCDSRSMSEINNAKIESYLDYTKYYLKE